MSELEPRFQIEVALDGDDDPRLATGNVRGALIVLLDRLVSEGQIRDYELFQLQA